MVEDSPEYLEKKARFNRLLTVFGRKPVLEALETPGCRIERLHLSSRNKPAAILNQLKNLTLEQGGAILEHDPKALSRISKNAKQDQGVAADIACPNFRTLEELQQQRGQQQRIIALDRITNPQNLGMIIRSVTASKFDALVVPRKGCAALSPLVIKASAGTLFKAPIIQVESLAKTLKELKQADHQVYCLSATATEDLFERQEKKFETFVLGNESQGVSKEIANLCTNSIHIPMQRNVESLNVAVTAALICFSQK